MKRVTVITLGATLAASIAMAHSGVKNAAVMARMNAMSDIGEQTKTIGQMAKGQTSFDAEKARAAAAAIARLAVQTPALFKEPEDDPKSEAKPAIWEDFADFTRKADELEEVALGLSTSISTEDDLAPAVAALGAACKSCHTPYRE